MSNRRDRLGGMVGGGPAPGRPPAPEAPTLQAALSSRRVLLYAPPPAPASAYVTILQSEGVEVLVATNPEAASVLLDGPPPHLVVALVPVLGESLRELFHRKAPHAAVRVVTGLGSLLEERVLAPDQAIEFTVRSISALASLLADSRGVPRERTSRMVLWAGQAAEALGFNAEQSLTARLTAALYHVPPVLSTESSPTAATQQHLQGQLLAELARSLRAPLPIGEPPPPGEAASRPPNALELAEAAAECALLVERDAPQPAVYLRRRAAAADLHPVAVEAVLAASGAEAKSAARGRVLIADPDAAARNLLNLRLSNEGYQVQAVADGRAALEAVRAAPPALILAETVLPGLDGYALLDTLKREGRGHIPFVFISSRQDPVSMNKGLLLGAADFLVKPVNAEVLLTKLQKLLGQALVASEVSARLSLSDLEASSPGPFPTVSYEELAPGVSLLGRFRILADLGEGGMGKVFKARDDRLEEDVVLKVMKQALTGDVKLLEHFKREIRLARRISHPSVVRTYDFWEAGPLKFVTMEFLEGVDLRHEIRRRGAFPLPVALRLAGELLEGLGAAHELGVVHRDIKPHNIFLVKGGRLKILDFGIAQGLDPATPDGRTLTTSVVGTPEYMSPEQLMGDRLDARTDLYSAGLVLFEMLTGRLPFAGADRMTLAMQRLHAPPVVASSLSPQLPPELDEFLTRLLGRDRAARFATALEALTALRQIRSA